MSATSASGQAAVGPCELGNSMREHEIRRALLAALERRYDSETLIVEELGLDSGQTRVDVAVVNGILAGFEIKSDWDTLERLPAQRDTYNRVFDEVTVVAGPRHLPHLVPVIPEWWGITVADPNAKDQLRPARPALRNPERDPELLVRLLWRGEAARLLEGLGESRTDRLPRRVLWARLVERMPVDQLAGEVRRCLRERPRWSTVRPQS